MPLNVCIIDDDMVSQFAARYGVQQSDHTCIITSYYRAEEALGFFVEQVVQDAPIPDILLLDLDMPGMDGWNFLSELENLFGGPPVLDVYIISAFQNAKDRVRAKAHPRVKGYLDKPVSKNDLDRILAS